MVKMDTTMCICTHMRFWITFSENIKSDDFLLNKMILDWHGKTFVCADEHSQKVLLKGVHASFGYIFSVHPWQYYLIFVIWLFDGVSTHFRGFIIQCVQVYSKSTFIFFFFNFLKVAVTSSFVLFLNSSDKIVLALTKHIIIRCFLLLRSTCGKYSFLSDHNVQEHLTKIRDFLGFHDLVVYLW